MKRADNKNKGDPQETRETIASPHEEITSENIVDTSSDYPYPPQKSEASKAPAEPVKPENPSAPTPTDPITPVNVTFPTALAEQAEKVNPKKNAKIIPQSGTESSSDKEKEQPASDMRGSIQASGPEGSALASHAQEDAAEDVREWSEETRLS